MTGHPTNVMVLLSGGLDSSVCVAHYKKAKFKVSALFINYGQLANKMEIKAALAVCKSLDIPLKVVTIKGFSKLGDGYILGRNAMLLTSALMTFPKQTGIIAIGIHSGTLYEDCTEHFISTMQKTFDLYTDGCITIGAPFLNWTKNDIWMYAKELTFPIQLTYSCEKGSPQPCGSCLSCLDMEALHASASK